jgi:hypothetical protein
MAIAEKASGKAKKFFKFMMAPNGDFPASVAGIIDLFNVY